MVSILKNNINTIQWNRGGNIKYQHIWPELCHFPLCVPTAQQTHPAWNRVSVYENCYPLE
jgi:hypothetical protein